MTTSNKFKNHQVKFDRPSIKSNTKSTQKQGLNNILTSLNHLIILFRKFRFKNYKFLKHTVNF